MGHGDYSHAAHEALLRDRTGRPAQEIFIPVDLCNGNNGRLDIEPGGVVSVEAENNDFSQAQCFTSLDGASFAP